MEHLVHLLLNSCVCKAYLLNDVIGCTLHFGLFQRRCYGILEGFVGQNLELVVLKTRRREKNSCYVKQQTLIFLKVENFQYLL